MAATGGTAKVVDTDSDGFQIVRNKKGRGRFKKSSKASGRSSCTEENSADDTHVDIDWLKRRIQLCRNDVLASQFYHGLFKTLEKAVACATSNGTDSDTGSWSSSTQMGDKSSSDHDKDYHLPTESSSHTGDSNTSTRVSSSRCISSYVHTKVISTSKPHCDTDNGSSIQSSPHSDDSSTTASISSHCDRDSCTPRKSPCPNRDASNITKSPSQCDRDDNGNSAPPSSECETDDRPTNNSSLQCCGADGDLASKCSSSEDCVPSSNSDEHVKGGPVKTEWRRGLTSVGQYEEGQWVTLVLYGLGSFASCPTARYQLGLVLAIRDHLQIRPWNCESYDPKHTATEIQVLQDLGFSVISRNEEGKRMVEQPTVVIMPHCGKALFNNLLWANWSPRQLKRLVVLGNSFSSMMESGYQLEGHTMEVKVENNFTHTDIFNDLSIHWFPAAMLSALPNDTWQPTDPPVYDESDVEIILQSST